MGANIREALSWQDVSADKNLKFIRFLSNTGRTFPGRTYNFFAEFLLHAVDIFTRFGIVYLRNTQRRKGEISLRQMTVAIDKIIYRNKETNYIVFSGTVLTLMPKKKVYRATKEKHTFVGNLYCAFVGDKFEIEGTESFHELHGTQITIAKSKRIEPVTESEIRLFLKASIKKITPKMIDKIMEKYGLDAITALRNDPNAYDFLGLSQDLTDEVRSEVMQNALFEEILLFLQLHEIDCRNAMPIFKKYGDGAVRTLEAKPYTLYTDGLLDFRTTDRLYLEAGNAPDSSQRCKYGLLASIQMDSANNGNVFLRQQSIQRVMKRFLFDSSKAGDFPFSPQALDNAITQLENGGFLTRDDINGEPCIYLTSNLRSERHIAECLNGFMHQLKSKVYTTDDIDWFFTQYEQSCGIRLAPEQADAVRKALTSPVSIISGGPGTGKTQTLNAIIYAIQLLSPDAVVKACAPTGKAAIRISELTGKSASTIHRMLKIGPFLETIRGGELKCDFLFVDEFSMVDIDLCSKLFDAINDCGRIVIVGDYNQLPSVGPGLVLRDLIACKAIPVTMLKHVFRQGSHSLITLNASKIINRPPGKDPDLQYSHGKGGEFYFIDEKDPRRIIKYIIASIGQAKKAYGYSLENVQVLAPVRFGDLGVDGLNFSLQQALNPNGQAYSYQDKDFRVNDKVIHTKNNYDLEVFNGEVGFIREIGYEKDKILRVEYPDRDVWYPYSALTELDLAYALTVHKLQGSEFPVIIMPVHELQGTSLSKNLVYTALTRAKKMVVLVGSKEALKSGLYRETTIERESNLVTRIQAVCPPVCVAP